MRKSLTQYMRKCQYVVLIVVALQVGAGYVHPSQTHERICQVLSALISNFGSGFPNIYPNTFSCRNESNSTYQIFTPDSTSYMTPMTT